MPITRDPLFFPVADHVVTKNECTVSLLQRKFRIGYTRAARICDQLEEACVVGPWIQDQGRKVLADHKFIGELKTAAEELP